MVWILIFLQDVKRNPAKNSRLSIREYSHLFGRTRGELISIIKVAYLGSPISRAQIHTCTITVVSRTTAHVGYYHGGPCRNL